MMSLTDVMPAYTASFELNTLDGKTPLQLEVDFASTSAGGFDVSTRRWSRRDNTAASHNPLTGCWRGRVLCAATVLDFPK